MGSLRTWRLCLPRTHWAIVGCLTLPIGQYFLKSSRVQFWCHGIQICTHIRFYKSHIFILQLIYLSLSFHLFFFSIGHTGQAQWNTDWLSSSQCLWFEAGYNFLEFLEITRIRQELHSCIVKLEIISSDMSLTYEYTGAYGPYPQQQRSKQLLPP